MGYFTEVSQGFTSTSKGSFMGYINRSTSRDDDKGVNEKLVVARAFTTENWILTFASEEQYKEDEMWVKNLMNEKHLIFYNNKQIEFSYQELVSQEHPSLRIRFYFVDKERF